MIVSMAINFQGTTGDRVRLLRDYLKITQTELANRMRRRGVDVNPSYISRIEAGDKVPKAAVLSALASELGTTIDYLLLATDDPTLPRSTAEQIVLDVADPDERALIEEWLELIQDMSPEQRRSLLQTVRLLLAPYKQPRIIGG